MLGTMHIPSYFTSLEVDESWTYEGLKRYEITYLTHSYHRYPAKFIPQLARRLIEEHSENGQVVCDPFVGGGTTLVEGLLTGRRVIGVDVNPVACLAGEAKTTPIEPRLLKEEIAKFLSKLNSIRAKDVEHAYEKIKASPSYDRIRYWFDWRATRELAGILSIIEDTANEDVKLFLKCGFSHVLKNCSRWDGNTIKPIRDMSRKKPKVVQVFRSHIQHMNRKNAQFYETLSESIRVQLNMYVKVVQGDCRHMPCEDNEVSLIVTSPPYVTSYEYADLHQLSILWLERDTELSQIRKNFIGTEQPKDMSVGSVHSEIGNGIVEDLKNSGNNGYARAVFTYFAEMQQAIEKFYRVLKTGGTMCIVIGNTTLGGVNILNAHVLTELSLNQGFTLSKIIKRRVPGNGKFLPSARDPETGYFAPTKAKKKKWSYQYEYVLIFSKP